MLRRNAAARRPAILRILPRRISAPLASEAFAEASRGRASPHGREPQGVSMNNVENVGLFACSADRKLLVLRQDIQRCLNLARNFLPQNDVIYKNLEKSMESTESEIDRRDFSQPPPWAA